MDYTENGFTNHAIIISDVLGWHTIRRNGI